MTRQPVKKTVNSGSFKPGNHFGKGRPKGAVNKVTADVKHAVLVAFQDAQRDAKHPCNLSRFSRRYPEAFMAIASRLIPRPIDPELAMAFAQVLVIHE